MFILFFFLNIDMLCIMYAFFLQFVIKDLLDLPETLTNPGHILLAWAEADRLVARPGLGRDLLDRVQDLVTSLGQPDVCLARKLATTAFLTYFMDGGVSRLDYQALKLALGTSPGR